MSVAPAQSIAYPAPGSRPLRREPEHLDPHVIVLFGATGDLATLMELLAPDVTLVNDGGGRVKAARRPILGPEKVARFLLGIAAEAAEFGLELALVNGDLGMVGRRADGAPTVGVLEMADGKVTCIYILANPEKLAHVGAPS